MPLPASLKRRRLWLQLTFWFLIISLLPLGLATAAIYYNSENSLEQGVIDDLRSVAQRHSQQIMRYIRGQERIVTTLSRAPEIMKAMQEFSWAFKEGGLDSPAYRRADDGLRGYLTYFQESFNYDDLYLISPQGRVVFSVRQGEDLSTDLKHGIYNNTELAKAFDRANTMLETGVSDFDYYPVTNEPAAFMAASILKDGMIIGVVALQLNNDEIYKIINDYTGLGQSGETVVAARIGQRAVFQAPTRHDPYAAFRKKIDLDSSSDQGVIQAVRGKKGHGIVQDYRGRKCLAVWKYSPDMRWGMVTKIDIAEAFAPIASLRLVFVVVVALTLMGVLLAAVLVARSISRPVRDLTRMTKRVAGGDLDARVEVKTHNEVGELAESFNDMTGQLKNSMTQLEATTAAKERMESELDIARDIQMSMVPKIFPAFPERDEFEIFAMIKPARQVGGDLYDFFFLNEHLFCFLIGDVSGKGVPASLFMAVAITVLKALATTENDPSIILEKANNELCQDNDNCMFVTLFLAILDLNSGRLSYGNAGHNPPVIMRANGQTEYLQMDMNMALGVMDGMPFGSGSLDLSPDDAIFLYTDGVTEADNLAKELFGEQRLLDLLAQSPLQSPEATIGQIVEQVAAYSGEAPQADDITMVMLRLNALLPQ